MIEPTIIGDCTLYHGDNRDVLRQLPDNSISSVVTDPPYALVSIVKRFGGANAAPAKGNDAYMRASAGFMGKQWDTGEVAFSEDFWAEVLRVLKPGGHIAAFGASRGYHRMACAIEDAGFEIRDSLMWLYGVGFPKSHDVGQNIEKKITTGSERREGRDLGLTRNRFSGTVEGTLISDTGGKVELTTPEAQAWEGWGTALKPAFEPIVLARKPLSEGTVAANVLRWGTGALNIDGCRVPTDESLNGGAYAKDGGRTESHSLHGGSGMNQPGKTTGKEFEQPPSRWPANVVHDGSGEVVGAFPMTKNGVAVNSKRKSEIIQNEVYGKGWKHSGNDEGYGVAGASESAARFFYSAKASKVDRAGSKHPTVKPVALMEWLATLITPPGGTVLDPFAGSGTTGAAARNKGFRAVLIERENEYVEDIKRRLTLPVATAQAVQPANDNQPAAAPQRDLFGEAA